MAKIANDEFDQHCSLIKSFAFLIDETLSHNQTEIAFKLMNLTFELADKLYIDKNKKFEEKRI